MKQIRIPMSRIPILIGHEGETKQFIEKKAGVELIINSTTGEITILGDEELPQEDPLLPLKVEHIVKAIARGMAPENAFLLFNDDIYFKIIDIRDYVGKSRNSQQRTRARIIGEQGRTREIIEEQSGAKIAIEGYSVVIIGDFYQLDTATTAVDMILSGARHASVYSFLEKKRREAHLMKMPEL